MLGGANQVVSVMEYLQIACQLGMQARAGIIDFSQGYTKELATSSGIEFTVGNVIRQEAVPKSSLSLWIHDNLLSSLMNPEPGCIMPGYEYSAVVGNIFSWLAPGGIVIISEYSDYIDWKGLFEMEEMDTASIPLLSFSNRRQQFRYFNGHVDTELVQLDKSVIVARKQDGSQFDGVLPTIIK